MNLYQIKRGDSIKKLLHYLAFINLLDTFLTTIGLLFKAIEESNPLMSYLYEHSPFIFFSLKIMLSGLLIILSELVKPESKIMFLAAGAATLYTVVCLIHVYWVTARIVN
ncbi:DUF5658 family protein [Cytobacillus firmus]|uniref:DUF5658 family protein n=1 Tax=Cytobacillus firmus TaxID=1399 RepID=UPI001CFCE5C7